MALQSASKLESAYARGGRMFCHWDLACADLHDADLSGADLRGAQLHGADLRDAVLTGANLTAADLSGADLSGADLSDAQMGHVVLRRATLDDARLAGADLTAACLDAATLRRALLEDALLTRADLSHADLSRADLSRALLAGARARGTTLDGANLANADLAYVDLTNAALAHAVLLSANLQGAQLLGACLDGADLRCTCLADAQLAGAAQTYAMAPPIGANTLVERAFAPGGAAEALAAFPPASVERGVAHPVAGAEHTCVLPLAAQWLQRAAARQAFRYMQGEAEPADEVIALLRLHEYARTYLCPVTRIPRAGDEQDILRHLLGELPEALRAEAEPVVMAAEQEAQLVALGDLTAEEEEPRRVFSADPPAVPEALPPEQQDPELRDESPEALLDGMQRMQRRGNESWERLNGVLGCLENAYRLRAQTHEKLSKPAL